MKTKKSKKTTGIYKVFAFDADFVTKHLDDCETLVAMHSKNVSSYLKKGGEEEITIDSVEGFVCIQNASDKSKCIYRKVVGSASYGLDKEHAMLGHRSMKQLDIKENEKVIIKHTRWYCYLWNHYDSLVRYPFKIAIYFGLLSLILSLVSMY
jgi:hypothetical protein